MTRQRLYLDHNAGAPPRPEAIEAAVAALRAGGNASSVHAEGREARRRIEAARQEVAALVGAGPRQVVFTASATEANVTALSPDLSRAGRAVVATRLFVAATEHPSVLRGGRFPADAVEELPVDAAGVLGLEALAAAVGREAAAGGLPLVALQLANSETGVIQPVAVAARIVHAAGGLVHCDAVQAAGRLPIDVAALGVDFLALSAHKIGGIQGAGALVLARGDTAPSPLTTGGGQEGNRRAGTEAVAAIAAFGVAATAARADLEKIESRVAQRDWLIAALRSISPGTTVLGETADRLANTICLALPGVAAETAVIAFDLAGVAISAGSACSSGKVAASHVLKAMAVPADLLRGGIRISLGWTTTEGDLERFVAVWRDVTAQLGRRSGRAA